MNFSIFTAFLLLHIVSGTIGLITGLIAMIAPKGKKTHKVVGNIFFWSMAFIFASSLYMSIVKQNMFLFFIGFFSFYLAATGYRILALKKLGTGKIKAAFVDYVLSFSGLIAGIGLLIIAALLVKKGMFAIVPALFGLLSFAFGYTDIRKFSTTIPQKNNWLTAHANRMAGAFTATVTAFVVVNIQIENSWILWILPTIVIIPIAQKQVQKIQLNPITIIKTTIMKTVFSLLFLVATLQSIAQPYAVKNGKTRHRFAQLEVGLTQYFAPKAGETQTIENGAIKNIQFNNKSTTAIFFGGTHFWGHADFAITIPIVSVGDGMRYGVDLQAKYYPWRIEKNKLRPYVGISMSPFSYQQNDGPEVSKTYFPLLAGLNYMKGNNQFEIGAIFNYKRNFDYAISRTQIGMAKIQPFIIGATYKHTLETTGGLEKNWRNGTTAKRTKELAAKGKLNGFTLAVGPTSSFRIKASEYLKNKYAFAGQHKYNTTVELGAGYYMHKPDVQVNIAYRTFKSSLDAYGYHQDAKRTAVTLEAYKFLGDYHGFVPFIGPSLSYETLTINEKDGSNASVTSTYKGFKPGITFGWDIRPDRLQAFLLRTNLRWQPNLNVTMNNGSKNALDQLEFNFIQLVIFPGRMKRK